MGRPMYSTLIEPAVRVAEPVCTEDVAKGPGDVVCERWSINNPFDPDDDAFFESEHAVYEAFLTEEEVRMQASSGTLPLPQTLRGARVALSGSSISESLEQRLRVTQSGNPRVFDRFLDRMHSRAEPDQQHRQYVIPAETVRSRRAVSNQAETGSGSVRQGNNRIRARVLDRMLSGAEAASASGVPQAQDISPGQNNPTAAVFPVSNAEASPSGPFHYPIFSAYSEEQIRRFQNGEEPQEHIALRNRLGELRDAQQRLREAERRAEVYLRSGNNSQTARLGSVADVQRLIAERLMMQEREERDFVSDRAREEYSRVSWLIQQLPDSLEVRDATRVLGEAYDMIRRDDEMRQERRSTTPRERQQDATDESSRPSRTININTNVDDILRSNALSPSSAATSAVSSSGSGRIVAPRMARSPISPPSTMPLLGLAVPSELLQSHRTRYRDNDATDDDMPGLLDTSEDDSLGSRSDDTSDWGTDFSGRSSPEERGGTNNALILPPIESDIEGDDEAMDWNSYYDLTLGINRSSSPDEPNPTSQSQPEETTSSSLNPTTGVLGMSSADELTQNEAQSPTIVSINPIPIPSTPSRAHRGRHVSSGTPGAGASISMTPPASITPRFLTWGGRSGSPPSVSITPDSPIPATTRTRRRTSATPAWLQSSTWNAF